MLESHNETPEASDYDLRKTPDEALFEPQTASTMRVWIVAGALIVGAAIGAYFAFGRFHSAAPVTSTSPNAPSSAQPARPLGGDAAPIVLPALDQTDALVRELVKQVTTHPLAAAWLTTNGLIRNFAVVVANIAEGTPPTVHLRPLGPTSKFQVIDRGGRLFIDPRSYQRYDGVAAAAASIDPAGAARLYATLKPRIEEAYRDLGNPDTLDHALEVAIVRLLQTPVVADPVPVEPKGGTGYAFADPALESLTGPQKQLLRTGPANVRTIQSSLRAIALALGIPAERLPSPKA